MNKVGKVGRSQLCDRHQYKAET